jgi:hypothetical protein
VISERLLSNKWFHAILAEDEAFGQPSRKGFWKLNERGRRASWRSRETRF